MLAKVRQILAAVSYLMTCLSTGTTMPLRGSRMQTRISGAINVSRPRSSDNTLMGKTSFPIHYVVISP